MNNLILIGMPGAGKSTLGVQLAKQLGFEFVDTDLLIQMSENKLLQDILEETDYLNLRSIEERLLLGLDVQSHVIAPGGSAVYSEAGMAALKSLGPVVFLDVKMQDLVNRIGDYSKRGIASDQSQRFADIYMERLPLYRKYADISIDCSGKSQSEILEELMQALVDEEI